MASGRDPPASRPRDFLDEAAVVSAAGASREVFRLASTRDWRLITTPSAVAEVVRNLAGFAAPVKVTWLRLSDRLDVADDVLTLDKPAFFGAQGPADPLQCSGDCRRPVDPDRVDFGRLLGKRFYGLAIMTPGTNLADHPCLEREDILAAIAYAAQQTNHVVVEVA
jgi:hypothetical protein